MASVKRCPECRSSELELYLGGQFGKYRCRSCGYIGALVVEQDLPELDDRGKARKKKVGKHGKGA